MAAKRIKLEHGKENKADVGRIRFGTTTLSRTEDYLVRNAKADRRASIIETRHTDITLRDNGYSTSKYWTNGKVKKIFGICSKEHHMIDLLQFFYRIDRTEWLGKWELASNGSHKCYPYQDQPLGSYVFRLKGYCISHSGDILHENTTIIYTSRLVAAMKLPYEELWKAVLPRKDVSKGYVFEGSGRCNLHGHKNRNHCMNPSHLNMETSKQNSRRKKHHRGGVKCDCRRPCIGSLVRINKRGECCDNLYSEVGCTHAHGVNR